MQSVQCDSWDNKEPQISTPYSSKRTGRENFLFFSIQSGAMCNITRMSGPFRVGEKKAKEQRRRNPRAYTK